MLLSCVITGARAAVSAICHALPCASISSCSHVTLCKAICSTSWRHLHCHQHTRSPCCPQLPPRLHLPAMLIRWATMTAGGCLIDRQLLGSAAAGWRTYAWSFLCIVGLSSLVVAWLERGMRRSFAAAWAAEEEAQQRSEARMAQAEAKAGPDTQKLAQEEEAGAGDSQHGCKALPAPPLIAAPAVSGAGDSPQQQASPPPPEAEAAAAPQAAAMPMPSWCFNMSRSPGGLVSLKVKVGACWGWHCCLWCCLQWSAMHALRWLQA